jgi:hypothetical protein
MAVRGRRPLEVATVVSRLEVQPREEETPLAAISLVHM